MAKRNGGSKTDTSLQSRVGTVVRDYRLKLGITQEELAWRADMHRTYLADIERGGRNITLRSVAQLAEALQISMARLLAAANGDAAVETAPAAGSIGTILLVEDNAEDAELTLRVFSRAKFSNHIKVIGDGQEALNYLLGGAQQGARSTESPPHLVLLDLQLPGLSGLEVLRRMKADPRTSSIPVIVLTASRLDRDIIECGRLGAENYIIKPVKLADFCALVPKLSFRLALLKPNLAPKPPRRKKVTQR